MLLDWLTAALILLGVAFTLSGAIGLALLPDFFMRLHGPSKASTLGLLCLLLASMLHFGAGGLSWHELLIALFLFIAAPISAALLAQAGVARRVQSLAPLPPPANGEVAQRPEQ